MNGIFCLVKEKSSIKVIRENKFIRVPAQFNRFNRFRYRVYIFKKYLNSGDPSPPIISYWDLYFCTSYLGMSEFQEQKVHTRKYFMPILSSFRLNKHLCLDAYKTHNSLQVDVLWLLLIKFTAMSLVPCTSLRLFFTFAFCHSFYSGCIYMRCCIIIATSYGDIAHHYGNITLAGINHDNRVRNNLWATRTVQ